MASASRGRAASVQGAARLGVHRHLRPRPRRLRAGAGRDRRRRRGLRRRRRARRGDRHADRRGRGRAPGARRAPPGIVVSSEDDPFVARNDADWTSRLLVHVGPRRRRRAADLAARASRPRAERGTYQRTLIVLEEGAQAEVWEQYLSAARRPRRRVQHRDRARRGRRRAAALRLRPGAVESAAGSSAPSAPRSAATRRSTGSRSASARPAATCGWRPAWPARAPRPASPAPTPPTAASTSTSTPPRSTRRPTRPRDLAFRGRAAGPLHARCGRATSSSTPAPRRPTPSRSRATCCSPSAPTPTPSPAWRSRPTTCAAPTRRRSPRSTPSSSSTCARTAWARGQAKRLVIEGFLPALVERFPQGAVRDALSAALERRLGAVLGAA